MSDTEDDRISEEISGAVEDAINRLGEHVDTVQIFVTRFDPETQKTWAYHRGTGNFWARVGQITTWASETTFSDSGEPESDDTKEE